MPTIKQHLKRIYQKQSFYPGFLGIFVNPFYIARRGLLDVMQVSARYATGILLDVGCGTMPYKKLFKVEDYVGLEIDSPLSRQRGVADHFYEGGAFPFPDKSFDTVLCNQVLEHVFEPHHFISEIYRVLKPSGNLLLTVPFVWDEHEQPYDYARYTSFGLKHLLLSAGFKIKQELKIGADITVFSQLLNCYLYKKIENYSIIPRLIFCSTVMAFITVLGLLLKIILPKNSDLYLDNFICAERTS